jgi:hypothetical protein
MPPVLRFSLRDKLLEVFFVEEEAQHPQPGAVCPALAGAVAKLPECAGIALSLGESPDDAALRFVEENHVEEKVIYLRATSNTMKECARKFPNVECIMFTLPPTLAIFETCVQTFRKLRIVMGCIRNHLMGGGPVKFVDLVRVAHTNENITALVADGYAGSEMDDLIRFFNENPCLADRPWVINGGGLVPYSQMVRRGVMLCNEYVPIHEDVWWTEPRFRVTTVESAKREGEKRRSLFAFSGARFAGKTPVAQFLKRDGDHGALRRVAHFLN